MTYPEFLKIHKGIRERITQGSGVGYNLIAGEPDIVVYAATEEDALKAVNFMEDNYPNVGLKLVNRARGETAATPLAELSYKPKTGNGPS